MRDYVGEKAIPLTCNAVKFDNNDFGRTKLRQRKILINKEIEIGDAFITACHEAIHVYDYNKGLLSDRMLPNAFQSLGIKANSRDADRLILDVLGWRLYNKHRNDYMEILAYALEESMFKSNNKLVEVIIKQLEESVK